MNCHNIIAIDLGATKCAAGIIEFQVETHAFTCRQTTHVLLADTVSLEDLIMQIEMGLGIALNNADTVCIGAAGQYDGRTLHHLQGVYPYPMPFADLAASQHWPPFAVIHDYDTVVCATFTSYMNDPANVLRLDDCQPDPHARRVTMGLGTGLGLKDGILLPDGNFWLGKNEIGHIGIINPPLADKSRIIQHAELMRFLRMQNATSHQQTTLENILTGRGIAALYQFLYPDREPATPESAGEAMQQGKTPELLDLFAWYLGLFTGSVELIFMPQGGIWITGGVAIKHLPAFTHPAFTAGRKASPAYKKEREVYPVGVLKNPEHALIGAGFYAVRRIANQRHYDK